MVKLTNLLIYGLLLIFLFSCNFINKKKNDQNAEKTVSESIDETEYDISIKSQSVNKDDLFSRLAAAIASKDLQAYEQNIEDFKNIDSLVLYNINGDDNESYYSLLGLSCKYNNLDVFRDLIKKGANINIGSEYATYAQDAMYYAVTGANSEIVKTLIDKGSNVNNLYTENGLTPLMLAVMDKKYLMAKLLLDHGAKVDGYTDLQVEYTYNPLREAIEANDVEMVKLLLKYKPNIYLKDNQGQDAKALAKGKNAKEILLLLEETK